MICRTDGLVLRTHRMTESSLVVIVYSLGAGKLRLAARGARRPKSRFGASLQPVTLGHYVYYHQENRELQTLSEGDILDAFEGIKGDYERLAFASVVCELLDHLTVEQDRNPQLYSIAVDSLSLLERVSAFRLELALWYFQVKAADALGYRPDLSGCSVTGEPLRGPRVWFSPSLGGTANQEAPGSGLFVTLDTVRFLEWLQTSHAGRLDEAAYDTAPALEVRGALKLFLSHHAGLGRPQRAGAFLDRLIAGGPSRRTWSVAADAGPDYQARGER